MENKETQLVRALGLKESISMTIGTVVGVGLFTCGSAQIGHVGSWIIVITFLSLLISIWPCLIYGEMSAALPCAGGTYNYAKRGLNRVWANLAGWHYIISVVGIGAGETLAFANYFKILFSQFGIDLSGVDSRIIAIILVIFFLILNFKGIEMSGKAQTGFIFFFWGCAIAWFLYMIPKIHLEYFGGIAMDSLPPFNELMYIFGLVWWCYTGFETCVSMGAETKYPQYTLPRALKVSVYVAPGGKFGCWFTIVVYIFMLIFADRAALATSGVVTVAAIIYWAVFTRKHENKIPTIEEEIGVLEEPSPEEKAKMDKEYNIWKIATIVATIIALGIYIIPVLF